MLSCFSPCRMPAPVDYITLYIISEYLAKQAKVVKDCNVVIAGIVFRVRSTSKAHSPRGNVRTTSKVYIFCVSHRLP